MKTTLIITAGIIAYLGLIYGLMWLISRNRRREAGLPINGTDSQQRFGEADSLGVGGGADNLHSTIDTHRERNEHA